ncbi:MAG TPA: hypothetical protein VE860_27805, partial [Chthoniobacterales bacterium]|nr:hypothetical protein [Chthoniobacterales bacterium]
APAWRPVEPLTHAPEHVEPALVGRVGVVDDAVLEQEGHPALYSGPEREVVDEELRAPSEEVCQRGAPLVGLESILLVN